MLLIHPILQFLSTLIAIYVLFLGINRFRFLHLHQKAVFKWKRHVFIGTASLILLIAGLFGGMTLVYLYWHSLLMTGVHGFTALIMLPLMLFGLISGHFMNRIKKKREIFPLIHGINNLIVIILAAWQIESGWRVYTTYVLGG